MRSEKRGVRDRSNAGVELFRCLMMMGIVLHHVLCHSVFNGSAELTGLFASTIPAVDGFIVISAYFGISFAPKKFLSIFGQLLFYGIVFSICSRNPSPGNAWFVICYLVLMVFAPILNAGISSLNEQGRCKQVLWLLLGVMAADWLSRMFGHGLMVPGFGSHSFSTFILIYCVVRFARTSLERNPFIRRVIMDGGLVAYGLLIIGCGVLYSSPQHLANQMMCGWGYNNLLVFAAALGLFMLFYKITLLSRLCKVVTFIGPSLLSVYMLHDAFAFGKLWLLLKPCRVVSSWNCSSFVSVLSVALFVFALCLVIDLVLRRFPSWFFGKLWEKR